MCYHRTVSTFPPLHGSNNRSFFVGRGLYVPDTDGFPAHFRGMGLRIEDSVCIQEEHPFVLTTEAVKEVRHISKHCSNPAKTSHPSRAPRSV